jgi:hypothetical protein
VASRVWFHSKRLIECWVKQPKNEALRPHPTKATTAAWGEKPAGEAGDVLSTAKFTTVVVGGRKTWADKEKLGIYLSIYLPIYLSVLSCNGWWVSTGSSRAPITSIQTIAQIFNRGGITAIFSYSASEPFLLLFYLSLGLQTKWGNHKKVALLPMQPNCVKLTMSHYCCCKTKPTTGRHTQMGYQKKRVTVKLSWLGITTSKSQTVCWFLRQQTTSRPHTYMHTCMHTYILTLRKKDFTWEKIKLFQRFFLTNPTLGQNSKPSHTPWNTAASLKQKATLRRRWRRSHVRTGGCWSKTKQAD